MKNLGILFVMGGLFLASCGQQTTPASGNNEQVNEQSGTQRKVEIQPASTLPDFLNSHPDIKASLETQGVLQEVLDRASKGALQAQQTTPVGAYCTIDYATIDVAGLGDYFAGEADMNCSQPFVNGTSLEVITNRQPNFGQIDGIKNYQFTQWPPTNLYVSTNGSFPNERGQTYCTNATAFIVLQNGGYAASQQGTWDCVPGD